MRALTSIGLALALIASAGVSAAEPERAAIEQLNRYRVERGAPPLRIEPRLVLAARQHAEEIAATNHFASTAPDGREVVERIRMLHYPFLRVAVQLAAGYPDPAVLARHWAERRESGEHLFDRNLTEVGLGYARRPAGAPAQTGRTPPVDHVWVLLLAEPTAPASGDWQTDVLHAVNGFRARHGLGPLTLHPLLGRAAQAHVDDMTRRDFFDHISPSGEGPGQRAAAAGYRFRRVLENIAAGQPTAAEAVAGWERSDSHRRAMLDPGVTQAGVGYAYLPNDGGRARHIHYWALKLGQPLP